MHVRQCPGGLSIGVSSGTDADWPPHAATLQLGVAGRSSALFDSDPDMDGDQPVAAVIDGQLVKFALPTNWATCCEPSTVASMGLEPSRPPDHRDAAGLQRHGDRHQSPERLAATAHAQAIPAVMQACGGILDWSQLGRGRRPDPGETDADGPELESATVNGSTLTLTFDEALDAGAPPSGSAFTVTVDGAERNVVVVGVGGADVLLTLASAVEAGDAVTVAYDKPDGDNAIKDTDGNKADSFAAQAVTNNTPSSQQQRSETVQPPGSLTVARHETGKLKATWQAPASGPAPTGYTVQWKESADSWDTAADVSEANVKGTSHIIAGLTDGTAYSVRVTSRKGSENSDPTAEATATPTETVRAHPVVGRGRRTALTITFSEALDAAQTPDKSAFAVTVAGASRGVTAVSISGSAVTLTLASAVTSTDAVTVGYTAPTGESDARLKDLAGNEAASFATQAATNNTPTAVQPPGSLTVARHETGKLKATWKAPASGPAPTGYTVQWKESASSWDTAADVSEASVKATSYVITGLVDGTEYAVRVLARKGSADSDPTAEATATPTETVRPPRRRPRSTQPRSRSPSARPSTPRRPRMRRRSR